MPRRKGPDDTRPPGEFQEVGEGQAAGSVPVRADIAVARLRELQTLPEFLRSVDPGNDAAGAIVDELAVDDEGYIRKLQAYQADSQEGLPDADVVNQHMTQQLFRYADKRRWIGHHGIQNEVDRDGHRYDRAITAGKFFEALPAYHTWTTKGAELPPAHDYLSALCAETAGVSGRQPKTAESSREPLVRLKVLDKLLATMERAPTYQTQRLKIRAAEVSYRHEIDESEKLLQYAAGQPGIVTKELVERRQWAEDTLSAIHRFESEGAKQELFKNRTTELRVSSVRESAKMLVDEFQTTFPRVDLGRMGDVAPDYVKKEFMRGIERGEFHSPPTLRGRGVVLGPSPYEYFRTLLASVPEDDDDTKYKALQLLVSKME